MTRAFSILDEAFLILEILKRIPYGHSRITAKELQTSLSEAGLPLQTRTLQRYLKALVEDGRFCVDCDDRSRPFGYRILQRPSDLGGINLQANESLLLCLCRRYLHSQIPASVSKSMDFLFNEAEHLIERKPLNAKERSWLGKISVVSDNLPQKIPPVKPRIFALVSNALYDNHPLQISYQKKTGDVIAREIEPLALVQQNFRLYLIARYSHAQENSYRHFALHRITDAAEVDRSFIPPEDFSLSDYLRERDFNYSDETRIRWTLEFSNPEGARLLREAPFNTDQTITELPDGFFRLEVTLPNTRHIDAWLAMWAGINGVRLSQKEKLYPSDSDRSTLPK